ncbi:hypothetical protein [Flavobacterium sp.]|uniref:hypothetical protein n=1 Tax=Flavobacterium sp. TaxID=239 RepID=UPI0025E7E4C4|nr:hypothetical protein [Flavobacterium sp.]
MKIRLQILILLLTACSSCVSLKPFNGVDGILNTKEIEGRYSNSAYNYESYPYYNLSNIIDVRKKAKMIDVTSIEIKVRDEDDIAFLLMDKYGNLKSYECKYQFKEGTIFLKNKNFRLTGIPYLFGGYRINKSALTTNKNGDLLLSAVQVDESAILFIFPASTPKSNFQNLYPKISTSANSRYPL